MENDFLHKEVSLVWMCTGARLKWLHRELLRRRFRHQSLLQGLPREVINSKITPNLLKGFDSPDWKVHKIITHISSTAGKFPKKCVVLCITDIQTRASTAKCTIFFYEAVYHGFVYERMHLESTEALKKILVEANKRIQPTGIGMRLKRKSKDIQGPTLVFMLEKVFYSRLIIDVDSMDSQPPRQYEKIIAYTVKIDGGCSAHLEKHEKDQLCMELNYCLNKGNPHTDEVMRLESIEGVSKIQEEPNKPIQPNGTGVAAAKGSAVEKASNFDDTWQALEIIFTL
ncbi:hypothetical protein ARALYDRAFT_917621 [Arabidopsis lyrata subsp. lyrata]|uniref:Uncharacterized protein n=1 Tax=Arabidopsis lyrata subsp. lyrata TaxID=81972 RepID=D7MUV1_ARALL|nr:hypothetical protein ARALYDRAFT_917621 [Arabidopsis lyrata subsp. lyrata]